VSYDLASVHNTILHEKIIQNKIDRNCIMNYPIYASSGSQVEREKCKQMNPWRREKLHTAFWWVHYFVGMRLTAPLVGGVGRRGKGER
jgi:hypothetical protein